MLFIILLTIAAFSLATTSGLFSIIGLAQTFSGIFWSVVAMGVSLEYGKLIATSFLYRYWEKCNILLRTYLIAAILTLMFITSLGVWGYLAKGYQTDTLDLKQVNSQLALLTQEEKQLIDRKKEIDKQVSQLKADDVRGRQRLSNTFKAEQTQINDRLPKITVEKQQIQKQQIQTEAHTGPITYIAKAVGLPIDDATKYIIFILIAVFDPLAVVLTICVNIALKLRKENTVPEKAAKTPRIVPQPTTNDIPNPPSKVEALVTTPNKPPNSFDGYDGIKVDWNDPKLTGAAVIPVNDSKTYVIGGDNPGLRPSVPQADVARDEYIAAVNAFVGKSATPDLSTEQPTVTEDEKVLREQLTELEQQPHLSPADLALKSKIEKYFERQKIIDKVRSGTL